MPGSGTAVLTPLHALGATGALVRSGASNSSVSQMAPLTSSIIVGSHMSGAMTTGEVRARGFVGGGVVITAETTLPRITATSRMGMRGAGVLGTATASGALHPLFTNRMSGIGVLPSVHAVSYGSAGAQISAVNITLQPLQVGVRFGMSGRALLPTISVVATSSRNETITGAPSTLQIFTQGTLSPSSWGFSGAITLPGMAAAVQLRSSAMLPALLISTSWVVGQVLGFEGWAYNVRAKGMTRLTNMPFVQILQTRDGATPLAIGADGNLYELIGDNDNGAAISWQFKTGLSDFGRAGMKRMPYVYIDGIIQGVVNITVDTDDPDKSYTYEYSTPESELAQHKPHKRKIGNGIRTRNVAIGMSSTSGAYVEIDSIEPEIAVTQRSV